MRLISKCVVLALLAVVLLTMTAAAEIGTGVVDADSLRMRSEPSTDAATVTYLLQDTQVSVQQELDDWFQVSCGEYSGYVAAEFLRFTPSESDTASTAVSVVSQSASEEAGSFAVITGMGVNLRPTASVEEEPLALLDRGEAVTLLAAGEEWCQVNYGGQTGYVNADYINLDGLVSELGRVTGDCVNVRDIPSTDGGIVTKIYAGSSVDLLSRMEGWYQVSCGDGSVGYVCDEYLREVMPGEASSIGEDIVAKAREFLGTRYSYGGSSPKGFDCSGFTMYVFGQFGYSLPHSATSQWNNSGEYVERSDLQAGDLVLFCDPSRSNGKACSHVGIYIGDGDFIHASSSRSGGVIISSINDGYYNTYYKGAKRVG